MRLISSEGRPGVLVGDDRVLLVPGGSLAQILADDGLLTAVREAAGAVADAAALPRLEEVPLDPPVRPGKILCLGYNYRGHTEEETPAYPNVFIKTPNTISGPRDAVVMPRAATDVDYEAEIAVVIGRTARDVPEDRAMDHVAGYALYNDVSDRDWQHRTNQWALGKSIDGFGPLGPWIVTTDEVGDLAGRFIEAEHNGVRTVDSTTDAMVFGIPFLVSYLSQVITLEPGDIISTGTPGRTPQAQAVHTSLAHGDTVTIRVTGLGELSTTFVSMEENR